MDDSSASAAPSAREKGQVVDLSLVQDVEDREARKKLERNLVRKVDLRTVPLCILMLAIAYVRPIYPVSASQYC